MLYLCDTCTTLWAFLDVFPLACQTFQKHEFCYRYVLSCTQSLSWQSGNTECAAVFCPSAFTIKRGDRFNAARDCKVHTERNTETPREEINVQTSRVCLLSVSDPRARKPSQFQNPAKQYSMCSGQSGEGWAGKSCGQEELTAIGSEAGEVESISKW